MVNSILKTLNQGSIVVYTKQADREKNSKLLQQLKEKLPKAIPFENSILPRKQTIPEQEIYSPFKNFDHLTLEARALFITAMQVANLDFFTD